MQEKIDIGIPVDLMTFIETGGLAVGATGAGKSHLVRVIVEAIAKAKVQQIIIDPEGEFNTLRERYDFVLVSSEGEIPLNVEFAEVLATRVFEMNLSVILDLYELSTPNRELFVKRFLTALNNIPKEQWHPCMIYIDEADMFVPEDKSAASYAAVKDLCARGRKKGMGRFLATTRLTMLSKNVCGNLHNKFVGWAGQELDRIRHAQELGMPKKVAFEKFKGLSKGKFFPQGPAVGYDLAPFKVPQTLTTHPQPGRRAPTPPAPDAVKKLLAGLPDIPEQAAQELETKEQLRKEVRRLAKENQEMKRSGSTPDPEPELQELRRRLLSQEGEISALKASLRTDQIAFLSIRQSMDALIDGSIPTDDLAVLPGAGLADRRPTVSAGPNAAKIGNGIPEGNKDDLRPSSRRGAITPQPRRDLGVKDQLAAPAANLDVLREKGPSTVLKVLAMYPDQVVTKTRLSILSGYSVRSSGLKNSISKLRVAGFLSGEGHNLQITEAGRAHVGEFEPLPTKARELVKYWANKLMLGPRKIFMALADVYPKGLSKEEISAATGYSVTSSGLKNSLSILRGLHLVDTRNGILFVSSEIYKR